MNNPNFPTPTKERLLDFSGIRYGISYKKEFLSPDDPTLDPLHIHESLEIFFNISSNISFLVNNRLYPVKNGEALISRANEVHVGIFNEAKIHEYFCLWIDADENSPIFDFLRSSDFVNLFSFGETASERLLNLLFELEALSGKDNFTLKKTSILLEILMLLNTPRNVSPKGEDMPEELQRILDDINENFAKFKNVSDILENRFISTATLNRWFREYVHLSPKKFLDSKKLSYAAKLLSEGTSVTDACLASGFSDCSHFISLFKKQFGKTPFKYKTKKA